MHFPGLERSQALPLGYRPALDGVRGLAIVPVVLFHTAFSRHIPGGGR
jgi:peptidoglycan/LPS O-acetylase OafA/YrhL